jgi:hypothetical protein
MEQRKNDVELILMVLEDIFEISNIRRKSRERDMVLSRQLAMKVMREFLYMNLKAIGNIFDFDHTTVIHNVARINNLLATHDELADRRWDQVINDHRLRHIIHDSDQRICILIPNHVDRDQFMAHIRTKYPDCELD